MHTVTFWFLCVFVCTCRYTYICSFLKFWRHLDVFGWFWSPEYCRISEPFCWGEVLDWRSASALYLSLVTCKPVDISNIANPLFHGLFFEMKFCRFLGKTQLNPIPWSPLLGSLSEIMREKSSLLHLWEALKHPFSWIHHRHVLEKVLVWKWLLWRMLSVVCLQVWHT